ncbi:MAG: hypothetical protein ACI9MR_000001, partial [Myxococcota bacterium]
MIIALTSDWQNKVLRWALTTDVASAIQASATDTQALVGTPYLALCTS